MGNHGEKSRQRKWSTINTFILKINKPLSMKHIILSILTIWSTCLLAQNYKVQVFYDGELQQLEFAVNEIQSALSEKGHELIKNSLKQIPAEIKIESIVFFLKTDTKLTNSIKKAGFDISTEIKPEGYSLQRINKTSFAIMGIDAAGLMYGGLELAEQIKAQNLSGVKNTKQNPYMAMRGTKFNIPLDVRTPSYTDVCDAAQQNIAEMWNFEFWKEYIDNLARYRYNYISLWNLHPFPSMVKVPDYPDIALHDVKRSTVKWDEFYPLQGKGFCSPEILKNTEVLKKMTIEDKIAFWQKVMSYGKKRNVDFYVITWNIFTYGTEGKYGITDAFTNETTVDYFRKSVKQMVLTYPDLKGIGLTTGENMEGANFKQKEDWAYNTYAQGVLDALKEQPGRKITFVHRQHQTGALDIAEKFKPLIDHPDIEFIYSFKYAKAHVYSSTTQNYHNDFVNEIKDRGDLKTIWTLRNDDVFYFRWGAPDFVREFIKNIPYEVSRGYYYGSDQYVWGREFLSKLPETPRQLEIVKHWYHWMLWGRLGYAPETSNDRFKDIMAQKYPQVDATNLFNAWQDASMIYPLTTGFHWGALDFQWYIESGQSLPGAANTPSGFHDINRFISLAPHPGTNNISIPDYVNAVMNNKKLEGTTPIQVAENIQKHANSALLLIENMQANGNKQLALTLNDIRSMAYLGKYYAHKISAATEWKLFLETKNETNQIAVEKELNNAAYYWRMYTLNAVMQYKNPLWTNRVGHVNWREQFSKGVLYDLTITGSKLNLPPMEQLKRGEVLEAEDGVVKKGEKLMSIEGFTGSGYILNPEINWTFNSSNEGWYILEFKYGMKAWVKNHKIQIHINNTDPSDVNCFNTGSDFFWGLDRLVVKLNKGENNIAIKAGNVFWLDNVSIIPFY